jgi:hypothetical protein
MMLIGKVLTSMYFSQLFNILKNTEENLQNLSLIKKN